MIPQLCDEHAVLDHFVDHAVFRVNPPGPIATQGMPQRFRLTDTDLWIAQNIFDERVDAATILGSFACQKV